MLMDRAGISTKMFIRSYTKVDGFTTILSQTFTSNNIDAPLVHDNVSSTLYLLPVTVLTTSPDLFIIPEWQSEQLLIWHLWSMVCDESLLLNNKRANEGEVDSTISILIPLWATMGLILLANWTNSFSCVVPDTAISLKMDVCLVEAGFLASIKFYVRYLISSVLS